MKRLLTGFVLALSLMVISVSTVWALASEDITITVTLQILSVDVEDACVGGDLSGNEWAMGLVVPSTTCESWQAAPVAYTAAPASWQDGVTVTNDGNGPETFGLMVTDPAQWTNDTDAGVPDNAPDVDEYVYRAIFDTAGVHTLGADDQVDTAMQKAEDSANNRYTDGDADGENVAAAGSALLFVQFVVPSGTVEAPPTKQVIDLTISAETVF